MPEGRAPAAPRAELDPSRAGWKRKAVSHWAPAFEVGRRVRTRASQGDVIDGDAASGGAPPHGSDEKSDSSSDEEDNEQDDPCALTSSVGLAAERESSSVDQQLSCSGPHPLFNAYTVLLLTYRCPAA